MKYHPTPMPAMDDLTRSWPTPENLSKRCSALEAEVAVLQEQVAELLQVLVAVRRELQPVGWTRALDPDPEQQL